MTDDPTFHRPTSGDEARLALLDRRAEQARVELDRAVEGIDVPEFGGGGPSGARPILLAAAALAVLALIGAGLSFLGGDDGESSTIAGLPDADTVTHLVLDDPAAAGYAHVDAFGPWKPESANPPDNGAASAQGIAGEDPWGQSFVQYRLPFVAQVSGEPVDLAGVTGWYAEQNSARWVSWNDEEGGRVMLTRRLDRDTLTRAASDAVAAGATIGEPAAGYELLYNGWASEVFALRDLSLSYSTGPELPIPEGAGVGYSPVDAETAGAEPSIAVHADDGLVVVTQSWSEQRWRALQVIARDPGPLAVRGHEAIRYRTNDHGTEVAWRENEATLVRVSFAAGRFDPEILDRLVEMPGDEFDALVAQNETATTSTVVGQGTPIDPETGESIETSVTDGAGGSPTTGDGRLASVEIEDADTTLDAYVEPGPAEGVRLSLQAFSPEEVTTTVAELPSIETNDVVRMELEDGRIAVAGLIGPAKTELFDIYGSEERGVGPSTATVEDSDWVLFLVIIPAGVDFDEVYASALGLDNTEVTLPLGG